MLILDGTSFQFFIVLIFVVVVRGNVIKSYSHRIHIFCILRLYNVGSDVIDGIFFRFLLLDLKHIYSDMLL